MRQSSVHRRLRHREAAWTCNYNFFFPFQRSHLSAWRGRPGGRREPRRPAHSLPTASLDRLLLCGLGPGQPPQLVFSNCHVAHCHALSSLQQSPEVRGPHSGPAAQREAECLSPPHPPPYFLTAKDGKMTPALLVGGQFTPRLHQWALAPGHGCQRGIKQGLLSSCSCKIVLPLAAALQGAEAHTRKIKARGKREAPPGGHQASTQACDQSHPLCSVPDPLRWDNYVVPEKRPWGFHCRPWLRLLESYRLPRGPPVLVLSPPEGVQQPQKPPQQVKQGLGWQPCPFQPKWYGYHLWCYG